MDAVPSGTGVFYQAMPAVGADGKNIMKLIPVQMVNGQHFQTPKSRHSMVPTSTKAVTINFSSTLNPSATENFVKKHSPIVKAFPCPDLPNSPNRHPVQKQIVSGLSKVPKMTTDAANCEKSVKLAHDLPVTVKSPVLPKGQYLQIPPDAQVRTVPASELPPVIKKQIFTSSANSSGEALPSVVYVSPITTVTQEASLPSHSTAESSHLLSNTSNKTSRGPPSRESKQLLKLIPKESQRPNSPIRWTIEELGSTASPALSPLTSPSVTSEIVRPVSQTEKAGKHFEVAQKMVPRLSLGQREQRQENALFMCNGKVYFVGRKCSLQVKEGKSELPAPTAKRYEFNKITKPSLQKSLESVASQTKHRDRIIIPDEVIDLCDDDAQDDSSQQAASVKTSAVTQLDEDNVIFVSYIPPKSQETGSSLNRVTEEEKTSSSRKGQRLTTSSGIKPIQSSLMGSADVIIYKDLSTSSQQSTTTTQQLESMEVDVEIQSPVDSISSGISSQKADDNQIVYPVIPATSGTSSLAQTSSKVDDHLLRRLYGITANVRICLQRVDEASSGCLPAHPQQTESMGSLLGQKDHFLGGLLTSDSTPSLHTHSGLLTCSHIQPNTKTVPALKDCHSCQRFLKGKSCDFETESVMSYVEPIDEDFLSTDENDIPNSEDTDALQQSQSRAGLIANTRRNKRTRKRTICPCCIPGTRDPVVRSSEKPEELETWAWTTEQTSKRGGKTKAEKKDGKTPGKINCLSARNRKNCKTHEASACDSLSTTSNESDELERQEQIRRLRRS